MPDSYLIKNLLHLQDPQLTLLNCGSEIHDQQEYTLLEGQLANEKTACSCGGTLIGWGSTSTDCLLLSTAGYPTILRLQRQRKRCVQCHKTQVAQSDLISKYCAISHAVSQKIYQLLKKAHFYDRHCFLALCLGQYGSTGAGLLPVSHA